MASNSSSASAGRGGGSVVIVRDGDGGTASGPTPGSRRGRPWLGRPVRRRDGRGAGGCGLPCHRPAGFRRGSALPMPFGPRPAQARSMC